jgi:acyl carrier protein
VTAGVDEILTQRGTRGDRANLETRLVGKGSVLDSLGLVTLIVDLEQRIEEEFGESLTLANERAMSQVSSPFKSVGSLADHVHGLLLEARANARS